LIPPEPGTVETVADLVREAQDLRRELGGVQGYLRKDTAARVNELMEWAKQARPEDRVLAAVGPASEMPGARPHSPGLDPSFSDLRGGSARAELEQAELACQGASLHERVHRLRRSIEGESGDLPKRVTAMFDALMEWAREELPERERLEVVPEADPASELHELSELPYGQAQATLALIESELEHAGQG
jgi:hypothetical protein